MKRIIQLIPLFLILISFTVYSQWRIDPDKDFDADLDQLPPELFNVDDHFTNPELAATVYTINGYDNFYLATDLAEPHMSMNPLAPTEFFNAFNINNAHYTTDGWNWSNITPSFGTSMRGDPVTAYDSLGNLYYMNMYGSVSILGCRLVKSTDNGATWSSSVICINGRDKNWIACDQTSGPYANYVYCTMTGTSSPQGAFSRSTDNGATFSQTETFNTQTLPGMMVAVGPNTVNGDVPGGCVYVVTHSGSNSNGTYTFYLSTDGGLNFTQQSSAGFTGYIGVELSGRSTIQGMRTRPYPFIAADNSYGTYRGRLYLVYATNNPAGNGNKPDVYCRYSTDQGATWSSAVMINDDTSPTTNHQFFPAIWCDKSTGRLYAKWYDSRLCPTSDSMDVYASYSDDGGVTWAPNYRISNQTFKIDISAGAPAYQGDYDAITSLDNQSMLVWTDFRFNGFASMVAYFPDYAMILNPATSTVQNDLDTVQLGVEVPDVKAFTETITFTAEVSPSPSSGSLTFEWPNGNTLSSYPDTVPLNVIASGGVTLGSYTITVTGTGPNGTPVHKRTNTLTVEQYIPVELAALSASVNDNQVDLIWTTATETNNLGFSIERSFANEKMRSDWTTLAFVDGAGTTTEIKNYSYSDVNITADGKYYYRLKQIDQDGSYTYSKEVSVEIERPLTFALDQNYPNPFNPSTTISYSVPVESDVTITIYDALGRTMKQLNEGIIPASRQQIEFNAAELSSGTYFYIITASPVDGSNGYREVKKMLLLK